MSIGNGASAWPSVIVSNGRISRSEHIRRANARRLSFNEPQVTGYLLQAVRFHEETRAGRVLLVMSL